MHSCHAIILHSAEKKEMALSKVAYWYFSKSITTQSTGLVLYIPQKFIQLPCWHYWCRSTKVGRTLLRWHSQSYMKTDQLIQELKRMAYICQNIKNCRHEIVSLSCLKNKESRLKRKYLKYPLFGNKCTYIMDIKTSVNNSQYKILQIWSSQISDFITEPINDRRYFPMCKAIRMWK